MATTPQSGHGVWSVLTKKDEETGLFIAHCLDLHVKVAGRNFDEAWGNLKRVIKAHYEYCAEFDREGLTLSAPESDWAEHWKVLEWALKQNPPCIKTDTIELILKSPRVPDQVLPLGFQRVECAQAAAA